MSVLNVFALLYVVGALITAFVGLIEMIAFCDYGREDENYKEGKSLLKYSLIFPYAVYKHIKNKLDEADGGNEEE